MINNFLQVELLILKYNLKFVIVKGKLLKKISIDSIVVGRVDVL